MSCLQHSCTGLRCSREEGHEGEHIWVAEPPNPARYHAIATELVVAGREPVLRALADAVSIEERLILEGLRSHRRLTALARRQALDYARQAYADQVFRFREALRRHPSELRFRPEWALENRLAAVGWAIACVLEGRA